MGGVARRPHIVALASDQPAPDESWVWLVGREAVHMPDGRRIDLDAGADAVERGELTWATVCRSLAEYLSAYSPSIRREHRAEGHDYGHIVPGSLRHLTVAEGHEAGIPLASDSLLVRVRWTDPETRAQLARGQIRFTSPKLVFGDVLNDGTQFPVSVQELSVTSNPVQKRGQPSAHTLLTAALSADGGPMTPEEIAARMAALEERVAALEAAGAVVEVEEAVASSAPAITPPARDMSADEVTRGRVLAMADRELLGMGVADPARRGVIAALAVSDYDAYTAVIATLPRQTARLSVAPGPRTTTPVPSPAATAKRVWAEMSADERHQAATDMVVASRGTASTITYADAVTSLSRG